jgi:hypothetical protein
VAVRSLWLQEALRYRGGDQPPLRGDAHADVYLVGGGFTGHRTALSLTERAPALDVAIVRRTSAAAARAGATAALCGRCGRSSAHPTSVSWSPAARVLETAGSLVSAEVVLPTGDGLDPNQDPRPH